MNLVRRILTSTFVLALAFVPTSRLAVAQAHPASASAPQGDPLDINTASRDQLKALPGIGDAYADRIIKGRPYAAKNQLIQKGILPNNTYAGIQNRIIARRAK